LDYWANGLTDNENDSAVKARDYRTNELSDYENGLSRSASIGLKD